MKKPCQECKKTNPKPHAKEPKRGEAYRRGYQQGIAEERERWINQPANQHDEKIRQNRSISKTS